MPFMVIIWGSRFMGKVDEVEGLFYVLTKFGHLYYIPLIPTESYLVFEETEDGIRGASIPMSFKSILMAWFRAALVLGAICLAVLALVMMAEENQTMNSVGFGVLCAASIGLFFLTKTAKMFTHASYDRAKQLAQNAGLDQEIMMIIDALYGHGSMPQQGFPPSGPDPFGQPQQPMQQDPYGQQPYGQPANPDPYGQPQQPPHGQPQQFGQQQPNSQPPYDPNDPFGQQNQNWPNG